MFGIEEADEYNEDCRGETWHGLYLMLRSLFWPNNWDDELPLDQVSRAQILDWVRQAYLARLGVEYPPEERARMDMLIEEERTVPKSERTHES